MSEPKYKLHVVIYLCMIVQRNIHIYTNELSVCIKYIFQYHLIILRDHSLAPSLWPFPPLPPRVSWGQDWMAMRDYIGHKMNAALY